MVAGWTWVPVEEILQSVNDSADMGMILGYDTPEYREWVERDFEISDETRTAFLQRMIAQKAADPNFLALVYSIMDNGWTSAISWRPEEGYLGNGHHRLAAAILLCEDFVPTSHWGSIWSKSEGELGWDDEDEDADQIVSWYGYGNGLYVEV